MKIRSRQSSKDSECPYCREPCDLETPSCPGCEVSIHLECLNELTRCSSLGCSSQPRDFLLENGEAPRLDLLLDGSPRWRLALRRSLPLGIALALVLLVPVLAGGAHVGEAAGFALMGMLFGLVTLPGSWVEFRDASRKASWSRQIVAAAASACAASAIAAGAFAVGELLFQLGKGASLARALGSFADLWEHLARHPDMGNAVAVAGGLLGLVTLLRLRGVALAKQVGFSLLGAVILGGLLSVLNPMRGFGRTMFWAMTAVGALLLPSTCWLLDWLPWPGRRRPTPSPPSPTKDEASSDSEGP